MKPDCPHCKRNTNVLREGDGFCCLTCGSFGDDRLAAWERVVAPWPRRDEPAFLAPDDQDAQQAFRELMEMAG